MPPRDICKGCRECYTGILNVIVQNSIIAAVAMGIPTYYLLVGILFQQNLLTFVPEAMYIQGQISAPFYTILGFTIFAWFLEILAIRFMLPSLLSVCGFCHAAIGSWWFVNFTILFVAGWYYIPFRMMLILLTAVVSPAIIWHITGDIIRAYTKKLIEDIASHHRSLASQDSAFQPDPEVGGLPK